MYDEDDPYDIPPWPEDWEAGKAWVELLREAEKETDRGRTLMVGHFLDGLLKLTIRAFLIDGEAADKLTASFNSPQATFSGRISFAAALGLITAQEYERLEAFRAVRNVYAHSIKPNFDDKKVKKALAKLALSYGLEKASAPEFLIWMAGSRLVPELLNRPEHAQRVKLSGMKWSVERPAPE